MFLSVRPPACGLPEGGTRVLLLPRKAPFFPSPPPSSKDLESDSLDVCLQPLAQRCSEVVTGLVEMGAGFRVRVFNQRWVKMDRANLCIKKEH